MIEIAQHPLGGKRGLVLGIANEHSIAYGCAKAFRALGADLAADRAQGIHSRAWRGYAGDLQLALGSVMAADPPRNRGSCRSHLQREALPESPTLKT